MTDLSARRADFPLLAQPSNGHRLVFLDSAASAQKPSVVIDAMDEFLRTSYANVHRGAYRLSLAATEAYEQARHRVAQFIGSGSPRQVAFTRGTTSSLNSVAFGWGLRRLPPGGRILVTMMEHHANIVPWHMVASLTGAEVVWAPLDGGGELDLGGTLDLIDERVKIVAVTGMSNVLGTIPDLKAIADAAHSIGARVVVDGAQLIAHRPVDVETMGADFFAFSSHKLLGPTGIGVLWGRDEALEELEPFEGGGEMISDVTLDGATWAPIPHRFEAGTPPITEAVGLTAAIDYLDDIGMDAVASHDRTITAYALERLAGTRGVEIQGPTDPDKRGGAISFTMGDIHPHDLATILDEQGVAVRAGHHCAKPLMRALGVPATARASFSVYNGTDDVDALIAGLGTAAKLFGVG
ncbi:MAG TPA: SufS family cysteine desulfurase [Acidimicrobiia bacterium]|nr:SufS family cysteine desulfurase [Acidimicrobiia bacterium]